MALDVGDRRVGVAVANSISRLASPLVTLNRGEGFMSELEHLLSNESVDILVVGMPVSLGGKNTSQTDLTKTFVDELKKTISLPIYIEDESLSSVRAEEALKKKGEAFTKDKIDSWAASFILEDFMVNNPGALNG
jgi:putative Holliday junction resolvase